MILRDIVHEAPAESLYQVGYSQVVYLTYTTGIFKISNCILFKVFLYNYHINFEIVMSHFRIPSVMMLL